VLSVDDWVVLLVNENTELMLTVLEEDQKIVIAANVFVDEIHVLFARYISCGLDISGKENSPVHQGGVKSILGNREFYVTGTDGIRFGLYNHSLYNTSVLHAA
jgi:hypothetical protein